MSPPFFDLAQIDIPICTLTPNPSTMPRGYGKVDDSDCEDTLLDSSLVRVRKRKYQIDRCVLFSASSLPPILKHQFSPLYQSICWKSVFCAISWHVFPTVLGWPMLLLILSNMAVNQVLRSNSRRWTLGFGLRQTILFEPVHKTPNSKPRHTSWWCFVAKQLS